MFKLVTFDVTGTLLKFPKPIGEVYAEAGELCGIKSDPVVLSSCFKKNFDLLNKQHSNFGRDSGLGWEQWWKNVVAMTFQCALPKEEFHFSGHSMDLLGHKIIDLFNSSKCWELTEGTIELLQYLRENNIYTGVISNFDPRLNDILRDMCIDHFFSFILGSYECGSAKPDVGIFRKAAYMYEKKTKEKFVPSFALHVGDSLINDYFGAKNAGWKAAFISKHSFSESLSSIDKKDVFINLKDLNKKLFLPPSDSNVSKQ